MFALMAVLMGNECAGTGDLRHVRAGSMTGGMAAPAISALVTDAAQNKNLAESYGMMAIGGTWDGQSDR